ncbi:hypothetical protein C0J52_17596 [Blattella germanica]|nr:hypothetical protein C0J52_17596 [Blattella germanica]
MSSLGSGEKAQEQQQQHQHQEELLLPPPPPPPPVSTTTTTIATIQQQQQQQENQTCATYLFPSLAQPSTQTSLSGDLSVGVMSKSVSVLRGHARSASHGGVGASLTSSGSVGVVSRPSALKQSRGHQRAFSQGQIVEGGAGSSLRGHSRVGSRTDFILPPGHKDTDSSTAGSGSASKPSGRGGHSRQASRSESIYTLRQSGPPSLWRQFQSYIFRRGGKADAEEPRYRTVVPNHLVPPHTPKKAHPNGRRPDNRIRTTKYTFLSFLPKNLLEQFHRVANLYFICIVLLNWVPAINAFGKEIAMIPVLFVLGVTAIKDLFEDRRRHASDKRINNSTCRVYKR